MSNFNNIRALKLIALATALTLTACAGNKPVPEQESGSAGGAGTTQTESQGGPQIDTSRLNERGLLGIKKEDRRQFLDPNNPLSTRTIYFSFDSSRIKPEFADAIQAHAQYLADHSDVTLRLEGHTDERGTREYNVALGERRADSVEKALVLAGADAEQITTLSFGEERPAVMGHDEEAYAKNRRVELIYVQQ